MHVTHRIGRAQRLLNLRDPRTLAPPFLLRLIIRQADGALFVLQWRAVVGRAAGGPADSAGQQFVVAGLIPGALVVSRGGIEDTPLPLPANPCPRFVLAVVRADHQHHAVVAQFIVDIGFVPTLEAMHAAHRRMLGIDDPRAKNAGLMLFKPPADQGCISLAIAEDVRGTVDRHQPVAALDIVEHRLFLGRRQIAAVAIDGEAIELAKLYGIQVVDVLRESYVDAHRGKRRRDDFGQCLGPMVAHAVAEQQHANPRRRLGSRKRRGRMYCDHAEQKEPQ